MAITIAVAGAGALGRAVLDVLEQRPQYDVIVLTRKVGR